MTTGHIVLAREGTRRKLYESPLARAPRTQAGSDPYRFLLDRFRRRRYCIDTDSIRKAAPMLPIHAQLARRATESTVRSALPHAPVAPAPEPGRAATTRRLFAGGLLALADRISPEPVERSRWESG